MNHDHSYLPATILDSNSESHAGFVQQSPSTTQTLHLLCGKIASGKSTLTAQLSHTAGTIVIAEDDWLKSLYAEEMSSISDYMQCMSKFREIMGPHIVSLLNEGISVVLVFQANTITSRDWMRSILERGRALLRRLQPTFSISANWTISTVPKIEEPVMKKTPDVRVLKAFSKTTVVARPEYR